MENRPSLTPEQWAEFMAAVQAHNFNLIELARDGIQQQLLLMQAEHERTLLDRFAMAALTNEYTQHDGNPDRIAEWAYQVAVAMMGARKIALEGGEGK